jgi:hypothetical protein
MNKNEPNKLWADPFSVVVEADLKKDKEEQVFHYIPTMSISKDIGLSSMGIVQAPVDFLLDRELQQ